MLLGNSVLANKPKRLTIHNQQNHVLYFPRILSLPEWISTNKDDI